MSNIPVIILSKLKISALYNLTSLNFIQTEEKREYELDEITPADQQKRSQVSDSLEMVVNFKTKFNFFY